MKTIVHVFSNTSSVIDIKHVRHTLGAALCPATPQPWLDAGGNFRAVPIQLHPAVRPWYNSVRDWGVDRAWGSHARSARMLVFRASTYNLDLSSDLVLSGLVVLNPIGSCGIETHRYWNPVVLNPCGIESLWYWNPNPVVLQPCGSVALKSRNQYVSN